MTTLSKADYLKKYLSSDKDEEKKKKKKKKARENSQGSGLRIFEDDAFISVSANYKNIDSDEEKEDIAIISSITKEMEETIRKAPKFRRAFQPIDEVKQEPESPPPEKDNTKHNGSSSAASKSRTRHDSSDDDQPSTSREIVGRRHDSDSDNSPPRRRDPDPRSSKRRHDSDSSASPLRDKSPRKERRISRDKSPPKRHDDHRADSSRKHSEKASRRRHDSDQSPPRHRGERSSRRDRDSSADLSPRRKHYTSSKKKKGSDSDQSPSRRHGASSKSIKVEVDSDQSPPRAERSKRKRNDSESDQSPPRRRGRSTKTTAIKTEVDSDLSPPRKDRSRDKARGSDSDLSPPRKHARESSPYSHGSKTRGRHDRDRSPPRRREPEKTGGRRIATPEKIGRESQHTLDGKIAGLQTAEDLKKEAERLREREAKMFEELDTSVSGRFAETKVRQKQVRKSKDKPEDKERKEREAKKQAELKEKYELWNKGVAQAERRTEQLEEMARVAAEPLARMADDEEMNRHLKQLIHEEDPMAPMLQTKKREEALDRGDLVYPTYQGECPPNRFGIRPGYRWDGVDRSNGFEAKLALMKNKKTAQEREYYQNVQLYE